LQDLPTIPTNNNQLTNGEGYITTADLPPDTGLVLGTSSSNAYRGDRGKTAYDHSQSTHAPSNAQKNSDITESEVSDKLPKLVTDVAINQNNGNLIVSYSDGTSSEKSFGTIEATKFTE
jgi:hypothetical protein